MNPPRHLPGDGFPWFLVLLLGLHAAAAAALLRLAERPAPPLSGPAPGLPPAAVDPAEIRWVTASVSLPLPVSADLPDARPLPDETESDLPLPVPDSPPLAEPEPEPPSPPRPPAPSLRPAPAPTPAPETPVPPPPRPELRPAPAPVPASSPKLVAAVVPTPPVLTPAPPPPVVAKAVPIPRPAPVVAKAVPIPRPALTMTTPPTATATESPVPAGPGTSSGSGEADGIAAFHQSVREAYMSRWQQPRGLVVTGAKFRVRAEIVLDADGGVVSARIVASSGNAEMDQSVRDAVRQVSRVSSLPPGLADPTYAVILNFDL